MEAHLDKLTAILKEWYPTFNTHWDKETNCPCQNCADYRISKARSAIISWVEEIVGKDKYLIDSLPKSNIEYYLDRCVEAKYKVEGYNQAIDHLHKVMGEV
jgi:hypothetical protein